MDTQLLGLKAKDAVTGFAGTVTGLATYISGCSQALVVPPVKPDGSFSNGEWFDLQRLSFTDDARIVLDNGPTPGADRPAPKR